MLDLARDLKRGEVDALYGHHLSNGTTLSLLELTNSNLLDARNMTKEIANQFYNTVFYTTILPRMVDYYETKNYVFVHGWIPCLTLLESRDRSDSSQRKEVLKEFDTAVKESQNHDKHIIQQTYISSKYGELRIYRI